MTEVQARFIQHRPTVQIEVRGTAEQMHDWYVAFALTFPDHDPRVLKFNALDGSLILERNRHASASVS